VSREGEGLRILVAGAGGRMGRALREVLEADPRDRAVGWVDPGSAEEGVLGALEDAEGPADGVIEFTCPGAVAGIARTCADRGWPLVSGTTGVTAQDDRALEGAARKIPVLRAANMSLGLAIVRRCMREVARLAPPETEMEIVEIHHRGKRDAPSGTARALFELWASMRGGVEVAGRAGATGPAEPGDVGLHAVRLGDVVGEHQILWSLPGGERLDLTHRVADRRSFARGAVWALRRVVGRRPGLYGFDDAFEEGASLAGPLGED